MCHDRRDASSFPRVFLSYYLPVTETGQILLKVYDYVRTNYFYNGYIYSGKGADGHNLSTEAKQFLVPTCLSKPIHDTDRNVTADNWYSSIELVDILKKKSLTYMGTVKKNKREIPEEFLPSKNCTVGSTLYGFTSHSILLIYTCRFNLFCVDIEWVVTSSNF